MSVRTRARAGSGLTAAPVTVSKTYGTSVPAAIGAAEARSQMTPASPFAPGTPIGPYSGYSMTPRSHEFVPQYNVATRPRTHERVSFETLKGLIESYDVAQIVVRHRIASLRSLSYKLIAAEHYDADVKREIQEGMRVLKRPDGKTLFKPWLAKYLRDVLSYDAGTLYRMRNRAGRAVGLQVVSGLTIAPLLDYWGNAPDAPAPAYVQYVNGLPWNWLTRDDLIYEPYDPQPDSVYGRAPLEDIIINANTDIRFQLFFLQRFTQGNIPEAFASAPETWTPDQIEQFQEYWDGLMYGDQSKKHQIRWIPPGSKFAWSNEKEFTDTFSLFLMRKTCASYSVVPSDLGFTESVNRSSGESQADVQHRVGDLPLAHHVMDILTAFLQDDLQLPLQFLFDLGEEQDDRLAMAQAHEIYIRNAVVSSSEIREEVYGRPEPDGQTVPRGFFTERSGLIPLNAVLAVSGPIDSGTGAPVPGAPLPHKVFDGVEGILPNPPIKEMSLAEQEFGPSAMPPAPPPQPKMTDADVGLPAPGSAPVAKEGEGAPGITAETGLYSYDLEGREDDGDDDPAEVAKELLTFRRYSRARRKAGEWRDFRFEHLTSGEARRMNEQGRMSVRKDASGYDLSPRSGMISLDVPAGLVPPVPGGIAPDDMHVTICYLGADVDDEAFASACARAQAAAAAMPGPLSGTISGTGAFPPSDSSDGKVPAWAAVAVPGAEDLREALADLSASDHKDWLPHLTRAYVEPGDALPDPLEPVPVTFTHLSVHRGEDVRRFLLGPACECCGGAGEHSNGAECLYCDASGSRAGASGPVPCEGALDLRSEGGGEVTVSPGGEYEYTCPCGTPVIYDEMNGWQHADGSISHDDGESVSDKMSAVAKAGGARPKGGSPSSPSAPEDWPGWQRDLELSAFYAGKIRDALRDAVDPRQLAEDWARLHPPADEVAKSLPPSVAAFLAAAGLAITAALGKVLPSAWAEGWVLGQQSAQASAAAAATATPREASAALKAVDWAGWQPGDPEAAYQVAGTGLRDLLASQEVQIKSIASSRLEELGNVLADHLSSPETGGDVTYSVDSLTSSLEDVLDDPSMADMVAQTEIARAQSQAAQWVFRQMGVDLVRVSTAGDQRVCPRCFAAEADGPQPIGTYSPPIHARCRCALVSASPPLSSLASLAGVLGGGS